MTRINAIKRIFVRQSSPGSCGIACLAMVLNYVGNTNGANEIKSITVSDNGMSLLDLKNLANAYQLNCTCVAMEISYLKKLKSPIILHMVNDIGEEHFQVFFGCKFNISGMKYLIADPDIQVHYMKEEELNTKWISKSALYFDNLPFETAITKNLISFIIPKAYPTGMWVLIPFLGICIALFSVTLTWLLQKGLSSPEILKPRIILISVILLFLISIFKSLLSFLRQYLLIKINTFISFYMMSNFIEKLAIQKDNPNNTSKFVINNGLINIQQVQNAISIFIDIVLSDGVLILFLLVGVFYELPIAGLITSVYLFSLIYIRLLYTANTSYENIKVKKLSSIIENIILNEVGYRSNTMENSLKTHANNLSTAKKLATELIKQNLLYECFGTVAVISVMGYAYYKMETQFINYTSFVLVVAEVYLISTLMLKICSAIQQLADGADAASQMSTQ